MRAVASPTSGGHSILSDDGEHEWLEDVLIELFAEQGPLIDDWSVDENIFSGAELEEMQQVFSAAGERAGDTSDSGHLQALFQAAEKLQESWPEVTQASEPGLLSADQQTELAYELAQKDVFTAGGVNKSVGPFADAGDSAGEGEVLEELLEAAGQVQLQLQSVDWSDFEGIGLPEVRLFHLLVICKHIFPLSKRTRGVLLSIRSLVFI